MDSLTESSKVLLLKFQNPTSTFKFQMDEDQRQLNNMGDWDYIVCRVDEILAQNPNTQLQSFSVTELRKVPRKQA